MPAVLERFLAPFLRGATLDAPHGRERVFAEARLDVLTTRVRQLDPLGVDRPPAFQGDALDDDPRSHESDRDQRQGLREDLTCVRFGHGRLRCRSRETLERVRLAPGFSAGAATEKRETEMKTRRTPQALRFVSAWRTLPRVAICQRSLSPCRSRLRHRGQ